MEINAVPVQTGLGLARPAIILLLVGALAALAVAVPVGQDDTAELRNAQTVTVKGMVVQNVLLLPDNETVVLVGRKELDQKDPKLREIPTQEAPGVSQARVTQVLKRLT